MAFSNTDWNTTDHLAKCPRCGGFGQTCQIWGGLYSTCSLCHGLGLVSKLVAEKYKLPKERSK